MRPIQPRADLSDQLAHEFVVVAARTCARVTDTVRVAVTVETLAPVSLICSRMDEPTAGGYSPGVVTVWGELLLVTIVVVSPTQVCSVSFQATVQARTDTEPTESPVTESVYVAPARLRLPLFATLKYCGGGTLPAAKVNDV